MLSKIKNVTVNDYIKEIRSSIDNGNHFAALSLTLMIPDICSKVCGWKKKRGYVKWFNIYVYRKYYDIPNKKQLKKVSKSLKDIHKVKFTGNTCYALRNAILHSGTSFIEYEQSKDRQKSNVDSIELCINGSSDTNLQYGESVSIVTDCNGMKHYKIRINIINFITTVINGYEDFLNHIEQDDIELFAMIDWDN